MANRESRFIVAAELRAFTRDAGGEGADPAQRDIGGYAAVFNLPTRIGSWFDERVAPGAFTDAIRTCDVRALFNHDPNYVIGRNKSGTLTMNEDTRGLVWRATPPATSWAADLAVSIDRGDISGCSFSFVAIEEEWDYSADMPLRTLLRVDLYDVSAVTYPAYDDTSVAMDSRSAAELIERNRPRHGLSLGARARIDAQLRRLDRLASQQS